MYGDLLKFTADRSGGAARPFFGSLPLGVASPSPLSPSLRRLSLAVLFLSALPLLVSPTSAVGQQLGGGRTAAATGYRRWQPAEEELLLFLLKLRALRSSPPAYVIARRGGSIRTGTTGLHVVAIAIDYLKITYKKM